jgi:hypothetical protein
LEKAPIVFVRPRSGCTLTSSLSSSYFFFFFSQDHERRVPSRARLGR